MNSSAPWILIAVLAMIILLGILAVFAFKTNKKKRPIDYYNFFTMGLIWFAIGIPLKNYFMSGIGAVFLIISLLNKDKWEKNRVKWSDLTKEERKWKMIVIIALGILVLFGLIAFLYVGSLKN